jgi:N-acyl-D-aspartate/D-glutamate deacylase
MLVRRDRIAEMYTVPLPEWQGSVHVSLPLFDDAMARFLGRHSRDLCAVSLEQAVAGIRRLPAERMGSRDRGLPRAEAFADVTLFGPDEIGGRGTRLERESAGGIPYVLAYCEPVVGKSSCHHPSLGRRWARRRDGSCASS